MSWYFENFIFARLCCRKLRVAWTRLRDGCLTFNHMVCGIEDLLSVRGSGLWEARSGTNLEELLRTNASN